MKNCIQLILLTALLLAPLAALHAETLYNGIALPEVWPPQDRDPQSAEPMPVPYLQSPPQVIAIDVGRQLFVDDFLIESTDLQRTFHQARKHDGNPVLKPETAEEKKGFAVYTGNGGIFFDPAEQVFKLFYTAGWRGGLALATSRDMIRWTRPELGMAGGNLILPAGVKWNGGPVITSAGTVRGTLRAEVLDANGLPIAPFTLTNCTPVSVDSTLTQVAWGGASDLSALRGRPPGVLDTVGRAASGTKQRLTQP
jgi:hypothetical protein